MIRLSVSEVEHIAFVLAKEILEFNEPIPDFSTRYPNVLESSLETPWQSFAGKALYPTLVHKAGALFYLMIKNHPFQNGNKRIAMTTLLVFLKLNRKWVKVNAHELYQFTMWIAASPPKSKAGTVQIIHDFIRQHLIDAAP
ncbi:MAG: type II toxin-antitoxin system death-on-curing family toxin [Candidatus Omnitrophica bacterium CG11_big_fil_rev_8_21_14_0_20_45_26]|uniref:Type II toxin-antitoxin system death-on-curing family toxin n=1 Tax=Candidatus Abzuiibacterium crystallinum TaxID=1974748 RepID=A0A2H0LP19_9BACT|nr:MAG: type II toxin-antitoxin system death-on-curing family toxin [Candidatus Omnitrophica bacterium CG11_big_fil_rev_8_21_14_0_20_45_26]PIW65250.1 MAG: type II toxin-antitoxin system death-on-curing family toxin [Candidatus Omnitrophica bacterium CG12_big_fil_rev_8_21_14_0_65_45_16]